MSPPDPADRRHISPWTFREKIARALWGLVQSTLFGCSPRGCYRWRNTLLRLFGAQIDRTARIRPTVTIEIPWNLTLGANSSVGDRAILYCLGPITIGARVTISQLAHLCAGSHDFTQPHMPLLRPPITVEDDVWLAADTFVGPNVTIGRGCVVGARASVFSSLPAGMVCVGNPARPLKKRDGWPSA
ncbi:WcaF family extracellular polysaccharide biosynthesis acetyltransferase [Telmatocola sphagniphila]|uniref:WcaF family extracellular polysaccharide biosynthesis acetyltransferase n=1 Tax=Telmatocola sphagniphila TaxID=1123043 RepID=A0A8E6B8L8_9BACT|nr:WcaF family extracellular polysaccharide biosynthesis acetyltransferase [Telmatocola sphagniphila]QVL33766.1 WcaF family extracellular polysaccharide biosynthesis acetyltransferase [Telmatocola sphagniphila]